MCHEWWLRHEFEAREDSRRLWEEFEHTRPLSESERTEHEPEVTLQEREKTPLATWR